MIGNFNKDKNSGIKIVASLVVILIIFVWFLMPPKDKFSQVISWGNNLCWTTAKMLNSSKTYIFARNDAILTAKMYPREKKYSLDKMNNIIKNFPTNGSESELEDLYRDRADIELFFGDYAASLQDFLIHDNAKYTDYLKIAMLYNLLGDKEKALSYCNIIVNSEPVLIDGFACFSKIYEDMGNYEAARNLWELAVDRNRSNAQMRVELGRIKKTLGDIDGGNADMKKAKSMNSNVDLKSTLIQETIRPSKLRMPLKFAF